MSVKEFYVFVIVQSFFRVLPRIPWLIKSLAPSPLVAKLPLQHLLSHVPAFSDSSFDVFVSIIVFGFSDL